MLHVARPGVEALGELHVLGDVDHHRPRPAVRRDVKRLVQHAREIIDVLDQIIVLGARPGDADGVAFLEGVVADQVRRDLPGDAHQRRRIHQRVGEPGHRVGRARARGDQHAPDLAGRARIALRGMHRALLVAHQDVAKLVLLEQLVVDRQHRSARIAEDVLDPLIGERLDHHLGAGHLFCHVPLHSLDAPICPIKKGPKSPCRAPPRIADGSSIHGGAPADYENNKVMHGRAPPAFCCAPYNSRTPKGQARTASSACKTCCLARSSAIHRKPGSWWRNQVNCRLA